MKTNQCMGCQAEWPIKRRYEKRTTEDGRVIEAYDVHEVVGGYPHEGVACTKGRYVETDATL